jgi:hypothetical protein
VKKPVRPPATQPIDGDGIARGCKTPSSIRISALGISRDVAQVIPSFVQATPTRSGTSAQRPVTVEGVVVESRISGEDFPLKPWHAYYDWNFDVRPDPQYRNLLSVSNVRDRRGLLECEWDTAFFPPWAWPQQGERVWVVGRWIFDCGHPGANGYRTEIHPPKAVVSFRSEAREFEGGYVRANGAFVYIGSQGGYFDSDITDQDYEFSFLLPPRPSAAAQPQIRVANMTRGNRVKPQVTPIPANNPNRLSVRIPLKGVSPKPKEYGVRILGGWSDPTGNEAKKTIPVKVDVKTLFMDANFDIFGDEWYVYIGVNGRWKVLESVGGDTEAVRHTVHLHLHPTDRISMSVSGFEADNVHDIMGDGIGVPSKMVSQRSSISAAKEVAGKIRNKILLNAAVDQNSVLAPMFWQHAPTDRGTFKVRSPDKAYRLEYVIS